MYFPIYFASDTKGIPEFWLTAMKNVDLVGEMIQVKAIWVS